MSSERCVVHAEIKRDTPLAEADRVETVAEIVARLTGLCLTLVPSHPKPTNLFSQSTPA